MINTNIQKTSLIVLSITLVFFTLGYLDYNNKYLKEHTVFGQNTTSTSTTEMAKKIYETETLVLSPNVNSFIILIVNEAHESWTDEKHKLITDKNSYYIPTNLVIYEGTELVFLNADAPWDTPHPHNIEIIKVSEGINETSQENEVSQNDENIIFSSGLLDYTENITLPLLDAGKYRIDSTEYDAQQGYITVLSNNQSNKTNADNNLIMGGFYTPTNVVDDNKDNDGNEHPGHLEYYRELFDKNGLQIISEYNFTYAECDFCPGEYWPDNKSANHTLIIYETTQPLKTVLEKLKNMVKDNVYI